MTISNQDQERIDRMSALMNKEPEKRPDKDEPLSLGVDIGTANVLSLVVDGTGNPVTGEIDRAHVVREGVVVDYLRAVNLVQSQLSRIEQRLGRVPTCVVSAVPPGTEKNNGRITRNILEQLELKVLSIIDEPSAAARALGITSGAVVDVGGGTTGISILKDGKVIYTADEATGGFHLDLVLSGGMGIPLEEAERQKCDPALQKKLFPMVRPVFEKMITITKKYIRDYDPEVIYLVGGTSTFPGFAELMELQTGITTVLPREPLLVTPMGMALTCLDMGREKN